MDSENKSNYEGGAHHEDEKSVEELPSEDDAEGEDESADDQQSEQDEPGASKASGSKGRRPSAAADGQEKKDKEAEGKENEDGQQAIDGEEDGNEEGKKDAAAATKKKKKKKEKSAEQMRKEFFEKTTNEVIDDSMMIYISVTRVNQLISKVMEPVLEKAKQESDYARKVNQKMEGLNKEMQDAHDSIESLRRSARNTDDLNKNFARMNADFINFQQQMDNELRNCRSAIDNHKFEIQRVVREHEADSYRLERVQQVAHKVDRDFGQVQSRMMEMLAMHSEDFNMKTHKMKNSVHDLGLKATQMQYEQDHINMDLKDQSAAIAKLTETVRELTEKSDKLSTQVVDCSEFEKKLQLFRIQVEQFEKRLNHLDQNSCQYGSFVVRYLPLSYMIAMAEHLCCSGTSKQLINFKDFLDEQAVSEIKPIKNRKYNFIGEIEEHKEKLLKEFAEAVEEVDTRIAEVEEEEKQELDERAKDLEERVAGRLQQLEEIQKDFEKKMDARQGEAQERMDQIVGDLQERINEVAKGSSKNRKKEKLMKQLTKGIKQELAEMTPSPVNEVGSPLKKEKKSKKRKTEGESAAKKEEANSVSNAGRVMSGDDLPSNKRSLETDNEGSKRSKDLQSQSKASPRPGMDDPAAGDSTAREGGKKKSKKKPKDEAVVTKKAPEAAAEDDAPVGQAKKEKSKQELEGAPKIQEEVAAAQPKKEKKAAKKGSKEKKETQQVAEAEAPEAPKKKGTSEQTIEKAQDEDNGRHDMKNAKESKNAVMFDHMRSQDQVQQPLEQPGVRELVQETPQQKDKQQRRVQIMIPPQGEDDYHTSEVDEQEVAEKELTASSNSQVAPSAKNLATQGKPLMPIIKVPSKSSGSVHQLVSSERAHVESMPSSHAPATGEEMEGGGKSSKVDSGGGGAQSMVRVLDSEDDHKDDQSDGEERGSENGESEEKEEQPEKPNQQQEKTRADEDSSEEEEEEDEEDDDSDDDGSSSLGIDLSNYYTREEADQMAKEQILEAKKALQAEMKVLHQEQGNSLDQRAKALEQQLFNLDAATQKQLDERLSQMKDDIEYVLKSQQREKSDLQNLNQKLIDKIAVLTKKVDAVNESIESICTISLCLIESQCMQIRAEEQDEQDKVNIALMGQKDGKAPDEQGSHMLDSTSHYEPQGQASDRSPPSKTRQDAGSAGDKPTGLERQAFPVPLGQKPVKSTFGVKFVDKGSSLTDAAQNLKDQRPKPRKTLELDPICLSCTPMQADVIKKFKIACLAYAPSPVVFRNIQFSRPQILVFRKFLMGQCSKIAHMKEPYRSLQMSTKRIFDDMYLFLKEANMKSLSRQGHNIHTSLDEMNGLPVSSYLEVTSQYWNLIYKNSMADAGDGKTNGRIPTLTVAGVENEYEQYQQKNGGVDDMIKKNPVLTKREKHLRNNNTSRGAQSRLENTNMDRNSVFGSHNRDSMDSMRIGKTRKPDATSRKQSAGAKDNYEDELNALMQASRFDAQGHRSKPASSVIKFQSPFKNQTPKTAHSQLGQPRSRLRDNFSRKQPQPVNVVDDGAGAESAHSSFVDQVRANTYGAAFQLRSNNPATGASLHQMMQYPMQGRHNLATAVGPRDRAYQTLQGAPDQLGAMGSKNLPPLQQDGAAEFQNHRINPKVNKHMLKLKLDKLNNVSNNESTGRTSAIQNARAKSTTPQPGDARPRHHTRSINN